VLNEAADVTDLVLIDLFVLRGLGTGLVLEVRREPGGSSAG
jgi:hypothetical protein